MHFDWLQEVKSLIVKRDSKILLALTLHFYGCRYYCRAGVIVSVVLEYSEY